MKWLTDLLTGKDGATHDIGRWSWLGSLGAVIAAALHTAWSKGAVDLVAFGQAIATVVGAHGAALWAKKDTEPPHVPPGPTQP
jgi:hypothetical protein